MNEGPAAKRNGNRRRSLLMKSSLLVIAASVLMALVLARSRFAENERLTGTRESFMVTGWGIESYDELYGRIPAPVHRDDSGRPLYSWRGSTALLPDNWFLRGGGNWDRTASWDSPANQQMADFPWRFGYDGLVTWDPLPTEFSKDTCQMAIVGPGTVFGDDGDPPRRLRDMPADAIVVVETRNSGIHWMQPGDFDIRTVPKTINAADGRGISSRYLRSFHVLFADGEVWYLSNKIPFEAIEKFFTIEGARENDRETRTRAVLTL